MRLVPTKFTGKIIMKTSPYNLCNLTLIHNLFCKTLHINLSRIFFQTHEFISHLANDCSYPMLNKKIRANERKEKEIKENISCTNYLPTLIIVATTC